MLINLSSGPASAREAQEVPLASPFDLLAYRSQTPLVCAPTWALAAWELGAMELHMWLMKVISVLGGTGSCSVNLKLLLNLIQPLKNSGWTRWQSETLVFKAVLKGTATDTTHSS